MTDVYLSSLERELRGLPQGVRSDILDGVREELRGLTPADAEQRIAELGDPAFIAASARQELPARRQDAGWYTAVTIVLLTVGGFVVPFVGWLVGVAFLWYSRTWTLRDKIVGTLLPLLASVLAVSAGLLVGAVNSQPAVQEAINPLLPGTVSYTHTGLIVGLVVGTIATAVYLLVRARRLRGGTR